MNVVFRRPEIWPGQRDGMPARTSAAGTTHTAYRDLRAVTGRGETVILRSRDGSVALHPRSLFPDPLLAQLRAGMPPR